VVRTLAALLVILSSAPAARAADDADEADLQFQLGAERYQKGEFRAALEHFMASNRLVANRNVVFNIARTFEQLRQYPDAYRYYSLAEEAETDPGARTKIGDAMARITPFVAVLRVTSDPPNAAVYIDREDLGSRGTTPRTLGLAAGRYRVIVGLPGYASAASSLLDLEAGKETQVALKLTQVLGALRVEGQDDKGGDGSGAEVHVDAEDAKVAGVVPVTLSLTPGRHVLFLTRSGYQTSELPVDVRASGTSEARVRMVPLTGSLVANSDVRDALIEIDGKPVGFTPAVLSVAVGVHRVRVLQEGFRPTAEVVVIRHNEQTRLETQLTQVEEVNAASRATESVEDAPSSVTIITGQELRAMGYPTVAEAIRGVRGIYLSDDRSYVSVGFRGFSRPGDYNNRVLLLIDGMAQNDDYTWSSYLGFDGRCDLADVERIEVVRGAGSVLYGTGAFFGVINLVTRGRGGKTHGEAGVGAAEDGVGRARASVTVRLGEDAGVWMSVSGAHAAGRDFFFPEYQADTAGGAAGVARGMDGFDAGTISGRAWWRSLSAQWFLHARRKLVPTGEYETTFGERTTLSDTRGFVEARFEPQVSRAVQLLTRAHVNLYRFSDSLAYAPEDGGRAKESYTGDWAGLEQRVVLTPVPALRLTLGGELQRHFTVHQEGKDETASYLDQSNPFTVGAAYVVGDVSPAPRLKISAGARADYYTTFGVSVNPKLAVIWKPYERGNLKIMAGRAFRAPSIYELFYNDAGKTQVASPDLHPEAVYSGEIEFTHRFSTTVLATVGAFTSYVTDLIVPLGSGTGADPTHYMNSGAPVLSTGASVEVRREWRQGWMLAASYTYQRSRYLDAPDLREVPNSPEHLGSVRAAVPLVGRAIMAMSRLTLEGPRWDRYDREGDAAQARTDPAALWDFVISGEAERPGVRYAVGVYNVFDWKWSAPVSTEFRQRVVPQSGRTLLASIDVSF
jgi:outer membrane receptor for ferrienterochelin and colicin